MPACSLGTNLTPSNSNTPEESTMFFLDNPQTVVTVAYVSASMLTLFFLSMGIFLWKDSQH